MKKIIYIDGQNFIYKASETLIEAGLIKSKNDLTKFNFRKIFENIFPDNDFEVRYYGTSIKAKRKNLRLILENSGRYDNNGKKLNRDLDKIIAKSRKFADISQRIKSHLIRQDIVFVKSGMLKLRDADACKKCGEQDFKFQEKGVDVGMAVDILFDSIERPDRELVIVSSDTDIIPALEKAKIKGANLTYVGFNNRLTIGISVLCSKREIIRDSEIIEAFKNLNPELK